MRSERDVAYYDKHLRGFSSAAATQLYRRVMVWVFSRLRRVARQCVSSRMAARVSISFSFARFKIRYVGGSSVNLKIHKRFCCCGKFESCRERAVCCRNSVSSLKLPRLAILPAEGQQTRSLRWGTKRYNRDTNPCRVRQRCNLLWVENSDSRSGVHSQCCCFFLFLSTNVILKNVQRK